MNDMDTGLSLHTTDKLDFAGTASYPLHHQQDAFFPASDFASRELSDDCQNSCQNSYWDLASASGAATDADDICRISGYYISAHISREYSGLQVKRRIVKAVQASCLPKNCYHPSRNAVHLPPFGYRSRFATFGSSFSKPSSELGC